MVSLFLSCRALSSPAMCRFIPAHWRTLEIPGTENWHPPASVFIAERSHIELIDKRGLHSMGCDAATLRPAYIPPPAFRVSRRLRPRLSVLVPTTPRLPVLAAPWPSDRQCAGINRHTVGDERALQERNSETILASSFAVVIVR